MDTESPSAGTDTIAARQNNQERPSPAYADGGLDCYIRQDRLRLAHNADETWYDLCCSNYSLGQLTTTRQEDTMRFSALATALLITLTGSTSHCQTATRAEFEEFCQLVGGRWVGDVTWIADWAGFGKRGDKVTAYWEGRLCADGNTLATRYYGGNGTAVGMRFYDPGTNQIRQVSVNSGGRAGSGVYFEKDGVWNYSGTGTEANGDKVEATLRLVISDGGETHAWRGTVTVNGKKTDELKDVWRRVRKPR